MFRGVLGQTRRSAAHNKVNSPHPDPQGCVPPNQVRGRLWAQRLKRVFGIDIETCPACGGALRIIACIEDPAVINKILTHLDAKDASTAPARLPPSRGPPQAGLFD